MGDRRPAAAHLHGRRARPPRAPADDPHRSLSPLYDQVFTGQWPQFRRHLALKLGGTKNFADLDLRRFGELARRNHRPPDATMHAVEADLADFARAWNQLRATFSIPDDYREALRAHWHRVPLLHAHADSL